MRNNELSHSENEIIPGVEIQHSQDISIDNLLRPENPLTDSQIEKIYQDEPLDFIKGRPILFNEAYIKSVDVREKYSMAWSLITRGDFDKFKFLLEHFIPQRENANQEIIEYYERENDPITPEKVEELHNNLKLLLISKSKIKLDSKEAEGAEKSLLSLYERNEDLKNIRKVLPLDEALNVEMILYGKDMKDEEFEEFRSWAFQGSLQKYLGTLEMYRPRGDVSITDYWDGYKDEVFEDRHTSAYSYAQEKVKRKLRKEFSNGRVVEGINTIKELIDHETQPNKLRFLQNAYSEFMDVLNQEIPDKFVRELPGWQSDTPSPFPLFHQRLFAHEFSKTKRLAFFGDTGSTKTACSYLAMEKLGRKRVTVIGPAQARETWYEQAKLLFKEDSRPDVFLIEEGTDLFDKRAETANYVYISDKLFADAKGDSKLRNTLEDVLFRRRKTDGIIFDEADGLRNANSITSQMISYFTTRIRDNYEVASKELLPMVALTATPIATSLKDLNVILALLYPDRFVHPKHRQKDLKTFSQLVKDHPRRAHRLLIAEKRIFQLTLDDLFGDEAPKFEYERIILPLSYSQRALHNWIWEQPMTLFTKSRYATNLLLDPELFIESIKKDGHVPEFHRSKQELVELFQNLYLQWMGEYEQEENAIGWGRDWIAKNYPDLYVEVELSPELPHGIQTLLRESEKILADDWYKYQPLFPSPKAEFLHSLIQESLIRNNGVVDSNRRYLIFSPELKHGITRDTETARTQEINGDVFSLLDYLKMWNGEIKDKIVGVDGDQSIQRRRGTARKFNLGEIIAALATSPSIKVSMNWSLGYEQVEEVLGINLNTPWTWDRLKQTAGRLIRPGLKVPARILILEGEDTIDTGKHGLILYEQALTEVLFSGVQLTQTQLDLFSGNGKRREKAVETIININRTDKTFLRNVFSKFKGLGERGVQTQLQTEYEGKSFYQYFAEFYFDGGNDEYRIVGHNAELVKNLILAENPERVLSLGAGTCLFARKVRKADNSSIIMDNLDLNAEVLQLAQEKYQKLNIGNILLAPASLIPTNAEVYDAVESSFMLDWTKLYDDDRTEEIVTEVSEIERVKVFSEINRVLKPGGTAMMSFGENVFDEEHFGRFCEALTHFGFEVQPTSGISFSIDSKPKKRIGWIITVKKVGNAHLEHLDPYNLAFLSDHRIFISEYEEKERRNQQSPTPTVVNNRILTEFEIVNPLTGAVRRTSSGIAKDSQEPERKNGEVVVFGLSDEQVIKIIKNGLSEETYRGTFRDMVRTLQQDLRLSYKASEAIVCRAIFDCKLDPNQVWSRKQEVQFQRKISELVAPTRYNKEEVVYSYK